MEIYPLLHFCSTTERRQRRRPVDGGSHHIRKSMTEDRLMTNRQKREGIISTAYNLG